MPAVMIAVDWGTTACRATLLDARGGGVAAVRTGPGVLGVDHGDFAGALAQLVGPWLQAEPRLPIVMSGMIGSRQGWRDVPYLDCPVALDALAQGMVAFDAGALGVLHIVPGLRTWDAEGIPDVMRGEETQILGAQRLGRPEGQVDGLFVLPGTHSKWAVVRDGVVVTFTTYMSGEIFSALKEHTILGRLMPTVDGSVTSDPMMVIGPAFRDGVSHGARAGTPGALLHRLFSVRTLGLFGHVAADELADYLSGLLIGAEFAAAVPAATPTEIIIIGSAALAERYAVAAAVLGHVTERAPADCAARGAWCLARAAALIAVA